MSTATNSISFHLNGSLCAKLVEIATYLKQDPNIVMRKALIEYLEDQEDIRDAEEAYAEYLASGEEGYTTEQIIEEDGLQDYIRN